MKFLYENIIIIIIIVVTDFTNILLQFIVGDEEKNSIHRAEVGRRQCATIIAILLSSYILENVK